MKLKTTSFLLLLILFIACTNEMNEDPLEVDEDPHPLSGFVGEYSIVEQYKEIWEDSNDTIFDSRTETIKITISDNELWPVPEDILFFNEQGSMYAVAQPNENDPNSARFRDLGGVNKWLKSPGNCCILMEDSIVFDYREYYYSDGGNSSVFRYVQGVGHRLD